MVKIQYFQFEQVVVPGHRKIVFRDVEVVFGGCQVERVDGDLRAEGLGQAADFDSEQGVDPPGVRTRDDTDCRAGGFTNAERVSAAYRSGA